MSGPMAAFITRLASDRRGISAMEYAVLCAMMLGLALGLANQMNAGMAAIFQRVSLLAGLA